MQLSSPSQSRAHTNTKLIASASKSKEYLLEGDDHKESISSDADGVVSNSNADKDDEKAEVIGCSEADDDDNNDNNDRGFSPSDCDGSATNYKFSLRECDFPDMAVDITANMSSDLQNIKARLRQEQERNQGQGGEV